METKDKVLDEYEGLKNDIEMTKRAVKEAAVNMKSEIDAWMGEDITEVTSGRRKVDQSLDRQSDAPKRKSLLSRLKTAFRKSRPSGRA